MKAGKFETMDHCQSTLTSRPFYFLRHGETDWNRQRKWQGSADIPLNTAGIIQAETVRPIIEKLNIRTICVSPLQRAGKTADIVGEHLGADIHVIEDLAEVSFGPFQGSNLLENPWYDDWKNGLHMDGVEDHEAFIARGLGAINHALTHDAPVLIVAHGGIFWSVRKHARLDPDVRIWNCALYKLIPPDETRPFWLHEALNPED